jgi:uroporphyrinogen decarboxylase
MSIQQNKDIIKKIIEFDDPPRIGLDFNEPHEKDIAWILSARLVNKEYANKSEWGYYEDDLKLVPGFKGEMRRDQFGNIIGRLEGKTKGECIKGILQDGWENFDSYQMPDYDESYESELIEIFRENKGRFLLGALPVSLFATPLNLRRIDNFLMDVILEEENVLKLLKKVKSLALTLIEKAAKNGFDAVIVYDDWGTQESLLINPETFRKIFKPAYAALASRAHELGMKFFVHSCGFVYDIIKDFIEVSVDVFQFDQPELVGVEKLSKEFGGRVTFWCPVDIQKVMQTGDKNLIQNSAKKMLSCFGKFNGGFIAKDYPAWEDIDVKDEWAQWARDIFIANAYY